MRILIAQDESVGSDVAIEDMRRAGLPQDAKAMVLSVEGSGRFNAAQSIAETSRNRIQLQFPQWELSSEAFSGSPSEVILRTSSWWRPDLLIIGSDTFTPDHSLMSSVSLDVVHRAQCSVRIARGGVRDAGDGIHLVIGNTGSRPCESVVFEVGQRNWPVKTQAHVVSVVESTVPRGEEPEHGIDHLRGAGLTVDRRFVNGDPCQELLRESERCEADTIFIGPRCVPGMARFLLGSVATAVVTRARSTVEIVRPRQ